MALIVVGAGCTTTPPPPAAQQACADSPAKRQLPEPAHLPAVARQLLNERMATHGHDMSDLVWAMIFIDESSVAEIAEHIASQPKLARPLTGDASELSSRLPTAFFDLQDDLVTHAGALGRSARDRDAEGMANAYGSLTATCVRCHSAYMSDPPQRHDEP